MWDSLGLSFPVIVKPNYEGSSKGIGDDAVARDVRALLDMLPRALRKYPTGVLVEEFVPGTDVTVPFVEGVGDEGVLMPVDYVIDPSARTRFNIYDYRLKSADAGRVAVRCPPDLPRDVVARLRALAKTAIRALGIRDLARIDFRIGDDGRIYLLEVNALPSLEPGASTFSAAAREGLDYDATLSAVVDSAARRQGLTVPQQGRRRRAPEPLRIGFSYNVKRVDSEGRRRHRGRIRRARDHRLDPRRARELRPHRGPGRGHRRVAPPAHGQPGRSGVQHRRGRVRPQPRSRGARACAS